VPGSGCAEEIGVFEPALDEGEVGGTSVIGVDAVCGGTSVYTQNRVNQVMEEALSMMTTHGCWCWGGRYSLRGAKALKKSYSCGRCRKICRATNEGAAVSDTGYRRLFLDSTYAGGSLATDEVDNVRLAETDTSRTSCKDGHSAHRQVRITGKTLYCDLEVVEDLSADGIDQQRERYGDSEIDARAQHRVVMALEVVRAQDRIRGCRWLLPCGGRILRRRSRGRKAIGHGS
jgi:hypothetical protein